MKSRFVFWMWVGAGLMWAVFGLLTLVRLHSRVIGIVYLALAAVAFFIALRYKRKHFPN